MSQHDKIYKAIIFDCDGTIIPNVMKGLPSQKVTDAIKRASDLVHIGIATSRPIFLAKPIMSHLKLSGPSIIAGGAQIIDGKTFKILKEQEIAQKDIEAVIKIFRKYNLNYYAHDGLNIDQQKIPDQIPQKAIEMAVMDLDLETADKVMEELSQIEGISPHKIVSWKENKRDINLTDVSATKHHGILEIAKILEIKTDEIIGVGDGYNDFPLLMACGLKVAMGNAVDDLKAIADYIAPPVEEDGAAWVINKFVLV